MFPPPPPPEPIRLRRERQRADDATADAAADADQALTGDGREPIYARITGKDSPTSDLALYAWEFAVADDEGLFRRDPAGFRGEPGTLPAWETTGNLRVPLDGSALVPLYPSAGGLYYSFTYPAGRIPARLDAVLSAGSGSGAEQAYIAVEQLAEPAGHWLDLPGGRVFGPVYETNHQFAALDSVVWLERGHGAPPDVVVAIDTHGDGVSVSPVESVYLTDATGGTWTLAVPDGTGDTLTTAPLAWDADAATVEAELQALDGWEATTVTGTGTMADPFVVTLADTFDDLPAMLGDPFQLRGVQEWWFDLSGAAPCLDLQTKVERELRCDYPNLNLYERTLHYNCGDLQFPLPAFVKVAQVGCCSCEGSIGSHGSIGSVGSTGSVHVNYWCVVPFCCDSWTLDLSGIGNQDGCTCTGLNTRITLTPDPTANNLNLAFPNPHYCQYLWALDGLPGCAGTSVRVYLTSDGSDPTATRYTLAIKCFTTGNPEDTGAVVTYTATRTPATDCAAPVTFTRATFQSGTQFPVCNLIGLPETLVVTPNGNAAGANGCGPGCFPETQLHPQGGLLRVGAVVDYPGAHAGPSWPQNHDCVGIVVAGPFATADCGGVCGGGSLGSGPRYWCVRPDAPGSTGGGGSMPGSMPGSFGTEGGADCAVSCQLETDLTGTVAIGGAVTWNGGTCSGTVTAGPFGAADCGGACGGSPGSIPQPCCDPTEDTLHLTFGGMLADYGSVPVIRTAPGLNLWHIREAVNAECGYLFPCTVRCEDGLYHVQGGLYDRFGNVYAYFSATAAPTSCDPFDVEFSGTPDGTDPPGTVFLTGGGDALCDPADFTIRLTP
jgi:hypothetical protein